MFEGRIGGHDGEISGVLFQHLVEEGGLGFGPFATGDLGFMDDFEFFVGKGFSGKFQIFNQLEESLRTGELRILFGFIRRLALWGGDEVTSELELVVVLQLLRLFF